MKRLKAVFLPAEILLYVLILAGDWFNILRGPGLSVLKLAAILECFAVAFQAHKADPNYSVLQVWAFVFTAIADVMLLFFASDTMLTIGVASFLIVQILYMLRLWKIQPVNLDRKRTEMWNLTGSWNAAFSLRKMPIRREMMN